MGPKPWLRPAHAQPSTGWVGTAAGWYRSLASEVSPYTLAARRYGDVEGIDLRWAEPRSLGGRSLVAIGGGHPALSGLPLATFDHFARGVRRGFGVAAYSVRAEFVVHEHPFRTLGP